MTATPAVAAAGTVAANGCVGAPSQGSATIDLVKSEVVLRAYFSEADAQAVASSVRAGRGTLPLLRALGAAYGGVLGSLGRPGRHVQIVKERTEEEDLLGPLTARVAPVVMGWLRQRLRGWTMTMLAAWARTRAQEFVRASDDARCGVTIVVTLRGVPGLTVVRQAIEGRFNPASLGGLSPASMFRGTPSATVAVQPGRHLR